MVQDERYLDAVSFVRRTADAHTKTLAEKWDIWNSGDERKYRFEYDRPVNFVVMEGAAVLEFENGDVLSIEQNDMVEIRPHTAAKWQISEPIKNRYRYL